MTINLEPDVLVYLAGGIVLAFLALVGAVAMAARALKTASQANGKLSDTLMKLNDELSEHSADRRTWETNRRDLSQRVELLETDLTQSTEKVAALETKEAEQRTVIEQLTGELGRLKGQLKQEQDARKSEVAAANTTISGLLKEVECLHTGNNNAREQISELQSKVTAYEDTIRRMEAEIGRLQHDLGAAQTAKAEAEKKLELERQAMQAQLDALSARLEQQEPSPATNMTAETIGNDMPLESGNTEGDKDYE